MTHTLYIEYWSQVVPDAVLGDLVVLNWTTPQNFSNGAIEQQVINIVPAAAVNLGATPPIFPDIATAFSNYMTAMCAQLITDTNNFYGTPGYYTASNPQPVDNIVNDALSSIATNIFGKSNKSSFSAVAALAAHGIANASAASNPGLQTNYNLVSGVLGLANGLNDANTAQNDLATKYNDLEVKFNSALTWLGTNKDKINATITAGSA